METRGKRKKQIESERVHETGSSDEELGMLFEDDESEVEEEFEERWPKVGKGLPRTPMPKIQDGTDDSDELSEEETVVKGVSRLKVQEERLALGENIEGSLSHESIKVGRLSGSLGKVKNDDSVEGIKVGRVSDNLSQASSIKEGRASSNLSQMIDNIIGVVKEGRLGGNSSQVKTDDSVEGIKVGRLGTEKVEKVDNMKQSGKKIVVNVKSGTKQVGRLAYDGANKLNSSGMSLRCGKKKPTKYPVNDYEEQGEY